MRHISTTRLFGALALAATLMTGCGRGPGPEKDEWGQILYWLIDSGTATQTSCTDDPDLSTIYPTVPDFNEGIAYYYIYLVGKDGKSAVSMDCQPTNENDCTPNTDMILQISDHVLRWSRSEVLDKVGNCEVSATIETSIEDKGGEAEGTDRVTFQFEGNDCDALEASIKQQSENGSGLRECVAERHLHATFSHARKP